MNQNKSNFQNANQGHFQNQGQGFNNQNHVVNPPQPSSDELLRQFMLNQEEARKRQDETNRRIFDQMDDIKKRLNDRPSGSGTLPSNTIANPRGDVKAITTRSNVEDDVPTTPTTKPYKPPHVVVREAEATKDTELPNDNGRAENIQPPVIPSSEEKATHHACTLCGSNYWNKFCYRCVSSSKPSSQIEETKYHESLISTSNFHYLFSRFKVINNDSKLQEQEPRSSTAQVEIPSSKSTPIIQPSDSSCNSLHLKNQVACLDSSKNNFEKQNTENHVVKEPLCTPMEPEGSLTMGNEHQNTIPAT